MRKIHGSHCRKTDFICDVGREKKGSQSGGREREIKCCWNENNAIYLTIKSYSPIVASREYLPFDDDNSKQLLSTLLMMQP